MNLSDEHGLRLALRLAGIKPNKNLGQHFLVDEEALEAVMAAGDLVPTDCVVEIGPGLGVMTERLCQKVGEVIAVEKDERLAALLQKDAPSNLRVLTQDVMRLDTRALPPGYKVVANIPYYLTSAITRLFLEAPNKPHQLSLLIQKEVAERIVAPPGKMTVLAVSVQFYAEPTVIAGVERHKFWPAPRVDSAILQLKLRDTPAFPADPQRFFRLCKAGFGERRKMLKNSLAGGYNIDIQAAERLIMDAGIPAQARAQELSLDDWGRLYAAADAKNLLAT